MNINESIMKAYKLAHWSQLDENLLSEEQIQFVAEGRLDTIKEKNKDISTAHDPHAEHKEAGAIVDHFAEKADPTAKKTHTQWIVNQYKQGNVRQEDHPRIHAALSGFEKYKGKLANKDIGQYKKLRDVEDAVAPHEGTHASAKAEAKAIKHEGTDLRYEDDHITIHHVKNEAAAKLIGKGTKWCTAGDNNNMFDHYHQDGPIHVIHHKTEKQANGQPRKWQFHAASNQFMDEHDDPISDEDFQKIKPSFHKAIDAHPDMVE